MSGASTRFLAVLLWSLICFTPLTALSEENPQITITNTIDGIVYTYDYNGNLIDSPSSTDTSTTDFSTTSNTTDTTAPLASTDSPTTDTSGTSNTGSTTTNTDQTVVSPSDPTVTDPIQEKLILVSSSPDHTNPVPLTGETVSGNIFVFISPDTEISSASFYLDDPDMTEAPLTVENFSPFDFMTTASGNTGEPFDTTTLPDGLHNISVLLELSSGISEVISSDFNIANTIQAELLNIISVTASNFNAEKNRVPENAIDGDLTTFCAMLEMPQWIALDLGAPQLISQTRISFYGYDTGRIYDYSVETSLDNANWTMIADHAQSSPTQWTELTFNEIEARYVRVKLNSANTSDFATIYEIEIYGQKNKLPLARPDTSSTEPDIPVNIDILANDINPDKLSVDVAINILPENGQAIIEPDNTITYIPNNGFTGTDNLLYEVVDNNGNKTIASVTIDVQCSSCLTDLIVTLTWNPNPDVIQGYVVYYGPTEETATMPTSDLALTSGILHPDSPNIQYHLGNDFGLVQGNTICFRLKAYNSSGFSGYSSAACYNDLI